MSIDLDELERRAKAATPGPWLACGADSGQCICRLVWSTPVDVPVAQASNGSGGCDGHGRAEDAAFIAAANPATILELVARVREAEIAGCPSNECAIRKRCKSPGACLSTIALAKAEQAQP